MRPPSILTVLTFVVGSAVVALLGLFLLLLATYSDGGEFTRDQVKQQIETAWAADIGGDSEVVRAEWSTAGADSMAHFVVALPSSQYDAVTGSVDFRTWSHVGKWYTIGVGSGPHWESGISASPSTLELGYDYSSE